MKHVLVFFVLLTCIILNFASAKELQKKSKQPPKGVEIAQAILKKYNQKSGVQVPVSVSTEKKVLGTKTQDKGILTHQSGKINLQLEGEKKSEMIFDGQKVYLISYPDSDLDPDGPRRVLFLKADKKNQVGILSSLFSEPKVFFANFEVSTVTDSADELVLNLVDKSKTLKPLQLTFSKKDEQLKMMTYTDDVGSETRIQLEKPVFKPKISKIFFKYKAQKNDEVTSQ